MKSARIFIQLGVAASLIAAAALTSAARAQQEPPVAPPEIPPAEHFSPASAESVAALAGTAFTYQGRLRSSGAPYTGNCDFQFSLWNAASGGTQIGSTVTASPVFVHAGLFTTTINFGDGAFNGEERFLQIAVRCPVGSGSYTTLAPRQKLTPAPYALALPGMRTLQNATSANVIGGYFGNLVSPTVVGGTISGGGESSYINRVTASYATVAGGIGNTASNYAATVGGGALITASGSSATVGGGYNNTASNSYATVGGGAVNTASGSRATVGGGEGNTASGSRATIGGGTFNTATNWYATVGGGDKNTASGSRATVGGGERNTASGDYATISGGRQITASGTYATAGGGYGNTASNQYATVSGGASNTASGDYATVGGGAVNTASGDYATVGGGAVNTASGDYATVPGGYHAVASDYGQLAYASGSFASPGDAQVSFFVLRGQNTTTSPVTITLYLDGSSASISIPNNRVMGLEIQLVGAADGSNAVSLLYHCMATNGSILCNTPDIRAIGAVSGTPNISVSSSGTLNIEVTNAHPGSRWVALVRAVEIGF